MILFTCIMSSMAELLKVREPVRKKRIIALIEAILNGKAIKNSVVDKDFRISTYVSSRERQRPSSESPHPTALEVS